MNASKNNPELINVFFPFSMETGKDFKNWPYHITLMTWYNAPRTQAIEVLEQTSRLASQFPVRVAGEAMFGARKDVAVYTIEPKILVQSLHKILLGELAKRSISPTSTSYIGDNFNPHITKKNYEDALKIGQKFVVDSISLVERRADQTKVVVGTKGLK